MGATGMTGKAIAPMGRSYTSSGVADWRTQAKHKKAPPDGRRLNVGKRGAGALQVRRSGSAIS